MEPSHPKRSKIGRLARTASQCLRGRVWDASQSTSSTLGSLVQRASHRFLLRGRRADASSSRPAAGAAAGPPPPSDGGEDEDEFELVSPRAASLSSLSFGEAEVVDADTQKSPPDQEFDDDFEELGHAVSETIEPPASLLAGKYTLVSTIVPNAHLFRRSGSPRELVVAKVAYMVEILRHRKVTSGPPSPLSYSSSSSSPSSSSSSSSSPSPCHPNLVRFLDAATLAGEEIRGADSWRRENPQKYWLVMERANGGTLAQLLERASASLPLSLPLPGRRQQQQQQQQQQRQLPAGLCFFALGAVLDAIVYLQAEHGVQHCDCHLGNVALHVDDDGGRRSCRVMLIDYGYVNELAPPTSGGEYWGRAETSAACTTARALLNDERNRRALPGSFVREVRFLAEGGPGRFSLGRLRRLRELCAERAPGAALRERDLPAWILEYLRSLR